VLRAFGSKDAVAFFHELGVALHEEEHGKLFPDSHQARTVLLALLGEAARRGVELRSGVRVEAVERMEAAERGEADAVEGLTVRAGGRPIAARRLVLATGGLSLPKTGSDGGGYALAQGLGHSLVAPTPALVPLVLEGEWHTGLSGVAHEVSLRLTAEGARAVVVFGSLLWTHFGASGPAILDVSRHLLRARLLGQRPRLMVSLLPRENREHLDRAIVEAAAQRPRAGLRSFRRQLPAPYRASRAGILPTRRSASGRGPETPVVEALSSGAGCGRPMSRRSRRVALLAEADRGRWSRIVRACPEEILTWTAPGRFNFQWAWSTGFVAGEGIASALGASPPAAPP
jgi:predicted Rossmann fold flavoprotein